MAPASARRASWHSPWARCVARSAKALARGLGIGDALGGDEGVGDLGALLRFMALPHLPAGDAGKQQHQGGDGVIAIGLPEFLQLFAANVFLDFAENITHGRIPFGGAGLACRPKPLTGRVN